MPFRIPISLKSDNCFTSNLSITEKLNRFIEDINNDEPIYTNEATVRLIFYLSRLQSIQQSMTDEEKSMDIWEIITHESIPYTSLSKELSCVDMVLIKIARLLNQIYFGAGTNYHLSIFQDKRKKYLHDDFIFMIQKRQGYIIVKSIINPFIQP